MGTGPSKGAGLILIKEKKKFSLKSVGLQPRSPHANLD